MRSSARGMSGASFFKRRGRRAPACCSTARVTACCPATSPPLTIVPCVLTSGMSVLSTPVYLIDADAAEGIGAEVGNSLGPTGEKGLQLGFGQKGVATQVGEPGGVVGDEEVQPAVGYEVIGTQGAKSVRQGAVGCIAAVVCQLVPGVVGLAGQSEPVNLRAHNHRAGGEGGLHEGQGGPLNVLPLFLGRAPSRGEKNSPPARGPRGAE